MPLITKSDFSTYVQFTDNVKDRLLDFHILKAEKIDFFPLVPEAFWDIINTGSPGMGTEMEDFFNDYCKPVLVHFAMNRFLIEAGNNITQYGLVVPNEPTSQPASDQARANIRNQYKSDLQVYLNKFYKKLKDVEYTFDGVVYDFDCKVKGNHFPKMRAI